MATSQSPALDSSYIYSLTSQLGTGQDASDQMTSFLSDFSDSDGQALVDKQGPLSKDDASIAAVTEKFLSTFGEIFWTPYGSAKDQKLRWSDDKDKDRITDLVSTVFLEKLRLYRQYRNKDLNVDAKGATPQPQSADADLEAEGTAAISNSPRAAPTAETNISTAAATNDDSPAVPEPKDEPSAPNDQEDSAIHVLTSRSRGSARIASARNSEVAANNAKSSPAPSPPLVQNEDNENKPRKFSSEEEYRQGVLGAIERAQGSNLPGAIQLVRTTLNEASVRDAVAGVASSKKTGHIKLTQINEKYMAWIFQKQDGSCLWVKPYKGKVTNGVVRYAGWTGLDGVFTDYPVTYGINSKELDTSKSLSIETTPTSAKRTPYRPPPSNTNSKIVNLKMPKSSDNITPTTTKALAFPSYIHGESATMERARSAILSGYLVDRPCTYCIESGNSCKMAERGRTCAYCIAQNRTATDCEKARQGIEANDYEAVANDISASPTSMQPLLTHSGRISRKPTRDNYIDRSDNDSDSALSSILIDEPAPHPTSNKLRRKASAPQSTPSLKRLRDSSIKVNTAHDASSAPTPAPATGNTFTSSSNINSHVPPAPGNTAPDVWFCFHPPLEHGGAPKWVAINDVTTMNSFFDAALGAWKKSGGNADTAFYGLDAKWPERPIFVEWRDDKDWSRMMQMLRRAHGDDHGEVEVKVEYRLAK